MAKILIVEDNPANMTLAVFLLESVGHSVLSATDAEAGLTLARNEHPDLILMDIQLPGIDGLDAVGLLKQDRATHAIPVVALTALAMKGDEERIRAAGCDDYVAKPMDYKIFLATIASRLATSKPRADVAGHRARILVVDDQPDNIEVVAIVLDGEGFLTVGAGSGEEALAMVSAQPPDLILLDIMMPGMNGYQVAAEIKSNPASRHIPILMITALDGPDVRTLALGAGADDLLNKPYEVTDLCSRVRRLLHLQTPGDLVEGAPVECG